MMTVNVANLGAALVGVAAFSISYLAMGWLKRRWHRAYERANVDDQN